MMAKLIDNIDLRKPTTDESTEPVSLVELLLADTDVLAEPSSTPGETSEKKQTRKNRRKRLKSSNSVNRRKASKSGTNAPSRNAQNNRIQQKNKDALIAKRVAKNQSGNVSQAKDYVGRVRGTTKKRQKTKQLSASKVARPVILATVDYDPTQKSLHDLLRIKNGVRRIKADKMQQLRIEDHLMEELQVVKAMQAYSTSKSDFLASLDPTSMDQYSEALSALGLNVLEDVSATEILYSLVFSYAGALISGTRRIDESADVDVESSARVQLTRNRQTIDGYRKVLRSSPSYYDRLKVDDSTDAEVSIKCLSSLLAKEFLASYNLQKEEIPVTSNIVTKMFQVDPDPSVLTVPKYSDPTLASGRKTAHGICFRDKSNTRENDTLNYPFEPSEIENPGYETKSVLQFLDDLVSSANKNKYPGITTKGYPEKSESFETPYARSMASYQTCSDFVETMFDASSFNELSAGDSSYLKFFNSILGWLSEYIASSSAGSSTADLALQSHALVEASKSHDIFDALIIYLAFRQEQLTGYVGEGSQLLPGPSSIVRGSGRLKHLLGGGKNAQKMVTTVASPTEVTISPPLSPDAGGTSEAFTAPEQETTIQTLQATDGENTATLESMFGTSYVEICDWFANKLIDALGANTSSGMSVTKTTNVGSQESLVSLLQQSSLPIFDSLLDYENKLLELFGADPQYSPFDPTTSLTSFSGYTKPMIFVTYTLLSCRICEMLLDQKSTMTVVGTAPASTSVPSSKKGTQMIYGKFAPVQGSPGGVSAGTTITTIQSIEPQRLNAKFSVDFDTAMRNIQTYLDGNPQDTTQIVGSFSALSSVINCLAEEEKFLSSFANSLSSFYTNVDTGYESVRGALSTEALDDVDLRSLIRGGLVPSQDMTKLFKTIPWYFNAADMEYNERKLRDKNTSDVGFSLLEDVLLRTDEYVARKKQKIICVGIPAGMLENIRFEPAEFDEVTSPSSEAPGDQFGIVVQKIDQVNSDIVYNDLEFKFSRDLFCISADARTSAPAAFLKVSDDFTCAEVTYSEALSEYPRDIVVNHTTDFALKSFLDLNENLDFREVAFPSSERQQKVKMSKAVSIPAIQELDTTALTFLTASNIAFDPKGRSLSDFSFWDSENSTISLSDSIIADPYSYSTFEYINSYGALFSANRLSRSVEQGLDFEKILCIAVDDDDFKIDYTTMTREEAAETQSMIRSQTDVSIGVETSEGIDMFTYKVVLRTYDESSGEAE